MTDARRRELRRLLSRVGGRWTVVHAAVVAGTALMVGFFVSNWVYAAIGHAGVIPATGIWFVAGLLSGGLLPLVAVTGLLHGVGEREGRRWVEQRASVATAQLERILP